jgi:hypothetical protein
MTLAQPHAHRWSYTYTYYPPVPALLLREGVSKAS